MNNKFRFHLCLVCIVAFAIAGCKVKRPGGVIPESEMENLLYDYHLAKSMGDNLPYSENYKKALYLDAVFRKHGTTQAVFDSSMVWYTRNTEVLSKIYEKVKVRLKSEQELVGDLIAKRDKKPKTTKQGDSIDVWPWQRMVRLTGEMMNNQYVFTLPTDSNYKDRDTLVWEVRYRFLEPMLADSLRTVTMAMQVIYEKDTVSHWTTVTEPGVQKIRLFADTLGQMKEIKGFIYYPLERQEKAGALLADCFSMTRYHCTDTLAFAVRDSLNKIKALEADSLKKLSDHKADSLKKVVEKEKGKEDVQRLTPEEMNRRRTGTHREKKPEQIEVVIHPQSVIHSAVEYIDGSVIAQLGVPDMRIPIQYAITWPERTASPVKQLNLTEWGKLTFYPPDYDTFVCMNACRTAISRGGLYPAAVNAANEQAVALFREGKIHFSDIGRLVCAVLERPLPGASASTDGGAATIDDIFAADREARSLTIEAAERMR